MRVHQTFSEGYSKQISRTIRNNAFFYFFLAQRKFPIRSLVQFIRSRTVQQVAASCCPCRRNRAASVCDRSVYHIITTNITTDKEVNHFGVAFVFLASCSTLVTSAARRVKLASTHLALGKFKKQHLGVTDESKAVLKCFFLLLFLGQMRFYSFPEG